MAGHTINVQHDPVRLAVLVSGGGTTLVNLREKIADGQLRAQIAGVIASNPKAQQRLTEKRLDVPIELVERKSYGNSGEFSEAVWQYVRSVDADLVCLGGFLSRLVIPDDFVNRVLNIHPALLPSFGGQGMYGHHVHDAVLAAGCKVSGCTVHLADQTYDTGPILVQRSCPVMADDTPETLAARVFEQERIAYPEAIALIAAGRVQIDGPRAHILAEHQLPQQ